MTSGFPVLFRAPAGRKIGILGISEATPPGNLVFDGFGDFQSRTTFQRLVGLSSFIARWKAINALFPYL